jgi:hypothetical protein
LAKLLNQRRCNDACGFEHAGSSADLESRFHRKV